MKWTRGPTIGRGSSATVSVATSSQTSHSFAVKSAELSNSQLLQKEHAILSSLSCPQIVGYRGFDITTEKGKQFYNLFLEYAPAGTLLDTIHKHGGRLPNSMIRSYTRSILLGLDYLHNNGVVHCDLKGQNILVDGYGGAKITDFGCAKWVRGDGDDGEVCSQIGGTPLFMAPEVARGEHQGFPADVWALGCTVVQMATGRVPWTGLSDPVSALYEIGFSGNVPEVPRCMSEEGKDFVSKCLAADPMNRWSVSELLKHDFVMIDEWIGKSNVDSPTSVLSQTIWESMESTSDSTWDLSSRTSRDNSTMGRIQKLVQSNREVPIWEWDDDWVTVRSNNTSQNMVSGRQLEDPIVTHARATQDTSGCVMGIVRSNFESCSNKCTEISGKCRCSTTNSCSQIFRYSCQQLLLLLCMLITRCNGFVASNQPVFSTLLHFLPFGPLNL